MSTLQANYRDGRTQVYRFSATALTSMIASTVTVLPWLYVVEMGSFPTN